MERGQSTTLSLLRGENPINEAVFTELHQQKITQTNNSVGKSLLLEINTIPLGLYWNQEQKLFDDPIGNRAYNFGLVGNLLQNTRCQYCFCVD